MKADYYGFPRNDSFISGLIWIDSDPSGITRVNPDYSGFVTHRFITKFILQ